MRFLKMIQLMAVAGLVSGCQWGSTDRLSADLELNPFAPQSGADESLFDVFGRKVQAAFPPGTTIADMTTQLEAAGFSVDLPRREAVLSYGVFPACSRDFTVRWTGDAVVEAVNGSYYSVCLWPPFPIVNGARRFLGSKRRERPLSTCETPPPPVSPAAGHPSPTKGEYLRGYQRWRPPLRQRGRQTRVFRLAPAPRSPASPSTCCPMRRLAGRIAPQSARPS